MRGTVTLDKVVAGIVTSWSRARILISWLPAGKVGTGNGNGYPKSLNPVNEGMACVGVDVDDSCAWSDDEAGISPAVKVGRGYGTG